MYACLPSVHDHQHIHGSPTRGMTSQTSVRFTSRPRSPTPLSIKAYFVLCLRRRICARSCWFRCEGRGQGKRSAQAWGPGHNRKSRTAPSDTHVSTQGSSTASSAALPMRPSNGCDVTGRLGLAAVGCPMLQSGRLQPASAVSPPLSTPSAAVPP